MKVYKILRNIFLVLCLAFVGIGIALIDNANYIYTIIAFIISIICICVSMIFDNLVFKSSYK